MATKRNVRYKCLYCDDKFDRHKLVGHIAEEHEEMIPEGFTPLRLVFNYVNKKPLDYHGKCTECGKSTPWDENKGRYDRQCGAKSCHDSYVKKFEENMMKTRGVTRISATAEGQKKMLASRKISGTYIMEDGSKKTYTGSYERKALEFMDKVLHIKGDDILSPGPILEYTYEGKTHIYITDFYYQPYNLIIEVKDGGNNPNKRAMPDYRAKQIAKEEYIIKHTNYNYLRLTDNNLKQLLSVFTDLKYQLVENTGERVIHINEGKYVDQNPILEYMNALTSGKVVGLRDSDGVIIKNILQNNVFSGYSLTDSRFDRLIRLYNGVLEVTNFDKELLKNPNIEVYISPLSFEESCKVLSSSIGKEVDNNFIYESIFNQKLYSDNQIKYNAKRINVVYSNGFVFERSEEYKNMIKNYIDFLFESNTKDEIDRINESIERIAKDNGQI